MRLVRSAVAGDSLRLAQIETQVSINPWSERRFQRICSSPSEGAVTERALVWGPGSQAAGFIVISVVFNEANINNIAVSGESQGQGVGRALLKAAIEQLAQQGVTRCMLEVRESNLAARALYDQFGFVLDGVRRGYYPTDKGPEDALLMSRPV